MRRADVLRSGPYLSATQTLAVRSGATDLAAAGSIAWGRVHGVTPFRLRHGVSHDQCPNRLPS